MDTEIQDLTTSAKNWVRRRHADRPARDNHGFNWQQPTEAELDKDQWQSMEAAIEDCDKLLQVPVLAAKARTLMFELTRCFAFKGDLRKVLAACCTCIRGKQNFDVKNTELGEFLTEKVESVVGDIVHQILDSELEILEELKLVTGQLRKGPFADRLVFQLAITMSHLPRGVTAIQPVSLASLLQRQIVWAEIIDWCGQKQEWNEGTPLGQLVSLVYRTLETTAQQLYRQDITLEALHTVVGNTAAFLSFLSVLNIDSADQDHLDTANFALDAFDIMLEQTQCYVTSVCSCGVKIDTEELRLKVDKLRSDYNTTPLYQVLDAFEDVQCAGSIPWIYSNQNSELFLAMWRSVGASICRELFYQNRDDAERFQHTDLLLSIFGEVAEDPSQPQLSPTDISTGTRIVNFKARPNVCEFEQGEVTELQGEGPQRRLSTTWDSGNVTLIHAAELNTTFAAFQMRERIIQAVAVGRQSNMSIEEKTDRMRGVLQGVLLEDQDDGASLEEQVTDVILTQRDVAEIFIPAVKSQWWALHTSIKEMTISTEDLRQKFNKLNSMDAIGNELRLLAATGDGTPVKPKSATVEVPWVGQAHEKLQEFMLLERLIHLIPSILVVRTQLKSLCDLSEDDDPVVVRPSLTPLCALVSKEPEMLVVQGIWLRLCAPYTRVPGVYLTGAVRWQGQLKDTHQTIQSVWADKNLGNLSELVAPVKDLFNGISEQHLDFFTKLHENELLVDWLLNHSENDKFTSLLQVCRPCVDDP